MKPPFGIAQIGKSFRNEITPGNFIFRTREFEQMEMEFFVKPGEDEEWHQYWIDERTRWYVDLGIDPDNLRHYEHPQEKLSHYSKRTVDIEYRFEFAGSEWGELEGIANRTDFDLTTHAKHSGQDLSLLRPGQQRALHALRHRAGGRPVAQPDDVPGRRLRTRTRRPTPRAASTSAPCCGSTRAWRRSRSRCCRCPATPTCRRRRRTSPPSCARSWNVEFDDSGAIGRRYRRQDEIGTPYCVTVDFDTLDDNAVTVRERDSMQQERIGLDGISAWFAGKLLGA